MTASTYIERIAIFALLFSVIPVNALSAQSLDMTLSIGEAISSGYTLSDGTVVSGNFIKGTNGTYATDHGESGTAVISGQTYSGYTFDDTTAPSTDPYLATNIATSSRTSVDNGLSGNHADFIGFHVHFSQPTFVSDFFGLSIDGQNNKQTEWMASFAYNGTTLQSQPTITLGSSTKLITSTENISSSWQNAVNSVISGLPGNLPSTWNFGIKKNGASSYPPDSPNAQAKFSYGVAVTDVFVLWGIQGSTTGSGGASAGVTGLNITLTHAPEPSSALLFFVGGGWMLWRRRHSERKSG
ncbi:MAG: PEP-CTERM sorting domain-containing protein [Chthoniobacterales bacterium]